MRIAVTGGSGQLGRAIGERLGREHDVRLWGRSEVDITDADGVMEAVMGSRPDAIIHAAAWTDVDGCERDPERARAVHVAGTSNVASAARKAQAHLIAVSTDLVFDGQKRQPYVEDDETNPLQVYGKTKLEAERIALETVPRCTVVRTAWLYDLDQPQGFVAAMIEMAERGEPFSVVSDQIGSPTRTRWLAARLGEIAETCTLGILHRVEPVIESRAQMARRVLERIGADAGLVTDTTSDQMPPRPARRPGYTPLASVRELRAPDVAHGDGCDC